MIRLLLGYSTSAGSPGRSGPGSMRETGEGASCVPAALAGSDSVATPDVSVHRHVGGQGRADLLLEQSDEVLPPCPTCGGSGEISWNPSWSGDPQEELSALCSDCHGDGVKQGGNR